MFYGREDLQKLNRIFSVGRNAKWHSHLGNNLVVPDKAKHNFVI
jgi:hypothetical protein